MYVLKLISIIRSWREVVSMVEQEDSELTSPNRHMEIIATTE